MRTALVVITLATTALSAQTPRATQQEIDRVAAFARLYGVVRSFYPGDAGVTVDWNRFAVHGVARVRRATDTATLETALGELFTPLGPGIEIGRSLSPAPAVGAVDPTLVAWRYTGPGGISLAAGPVHRRSHEPRRRGCTRRYAGGRASHRRSPARCIQ